MHHAGGSGQSGDGHHAHHVAGSSAPDQSPSWSMPTQDNKNSWQRFLSAKLRFTPALGFFFLFVGFGLWLQVIYYIRHHEPAENFAKLSNQLYSPLLPTTKFEGQRLAPVTFGDAANQRSMATAGAGFAAEPITGASPDIPSSLPLAAGQYPGQAPYVGFGTPQVTANTVSPVSPLSTLHPIRTRILADR